MKGVKITIVNDGGTGEPKALIEHSYEKKDGEVVVDWARYFRWTELDEYRRELDDKAHVLATVRGLWAGGKGRGK